MRDLESIIKRVQITEKCTAMSEKDNKYFFEVDRQATKIDIKRAVEKVFKVAVSKVNTMRYEGKLKRERTRNKFSRRPDWKRAIVTLKEGHKIELT